MTSTAEVAAGVTHFRIPGPIASISGSSGWELCLFRAIVNRFSIHYGTVVQPSQSRSLCLLAAQWPLAPSQDLLVPSQFLLQWRWGAGVGGLLRCMGRPGVNLGRSSWRPGLAKVQNGFRSLMVPEKPQEVKVNHFFVFLFFNKSSYFPFFFVSFTFSPFTFPVLHYVTILLPEWANRSTRHLDTLEFQLNSYTTTKTNHCFSVSGE